MSALSLPHQLLRYVSNPAVARFLFDLCDPSALEHHHVRQSKPFKASCVFSYLDRGDIDRATAATRLLHNVDSLLYVLDGTRNPRVLRAVISNPTTPVGVLVELRRSCRNKMIAQRAAKELSNISDGEDPDYRVVRVLEDPTTRPAPLTEAVLANAADGGPWWVAEAVLRRSWIPDETQAALIEVLGERALYRLMLRGDLTTRAFCRASEIGLHPWHCLPAPEDDAGSVELLAAAGLGAQTPAWLFAHPQLTSAAIRRFVEDGLGELVYAHPNCPLDLLDRAFLVGTPTERAAALRHPGLARRDLTIVALHGDNETAAAAAANPSTPQDLLSLLLKRKCPAITRAIVDNPSAPLALRRRAARRTPANPLWSPEVQVTLAATSGPQYMARVLEHRLGDDLLAWEVAVGLAPTWRSDLGSLAEAARRLKSDGAGR